ncbi:MAG: hypothetical protein ABII90_14835 [Bacteroidota bacterium]
MQQLSSYTKEEIIVFNKVQTILEKYNTALAKGKDPELPDLTPEIVGENSLYRELLIQKKVDDYEAQI